MHSLQQNILVGLTPVFLILIGQKKGRTKPNTNWADVRTAQLKIYIYLTVSDRGQSWRLISRSNSQSKPLLHSGAFTFFENKHGNPGKQEIWSSICRWHSSGHADLTGGQFFLYVHICIHVHTHGQWFKKTDDCRNTTILQCIQPKF